MNHTILVIVGHYLPGYKAGGPTRTISHLVEWLGQDFEFLVLTRDRDLGDNVPFTTVALNVWQQLGNAKVKYLPPKQQGLIAWARLLNEIDYDLIYLNSFFDILSIQTAFLKWLRLIPQRPLLLAPRGEFSPGALRLKKLKKRLYITLVKTIGVYRNVHWQTSSEYEAKDLAKIFPHQSLTRSSVHVAANLPAKHLLETNSSAYDSKLPGYAHLVFIARIARVKNLDFALRTLAEVNGEVDFTIYGPCEDFVYWQECQTIIQSLPSRIRVNYLGPIPGHQISDALAKAHVFFLPTLGENFGHSIFEAFSAGCPALISDRTPWQELTTNFAGWTISLDDPDGFVVALNELVAMDGTKWRKWSNGARQIALNYISSPVNLEANRAMFHKILEQTTKRE